MEKVLYFFGSVVITGVLIAVFESINPSSWPRGAVLFELLGCYVVIAAILGKDMARKEEQERQDAQRRDEEAAKLELEKHRLTLEAQRSKQEVAS